MALSTTKRFSHKAAPYAAFYNEAGEPRLNVEGIVEVAGVSDINVDNTTVSSSGCYIGKSADGTDADFTVAYASGTTLTLSGYPAGVSGFSATDIEFVRQINDSTGAVTATYSRDDAAMSIAANVLTVDGAAFTAADYFVILTNVPRPTATGGGGAGGGSIVYTNAAGDFVATITNATTNITITGLPFTLEAMHVTGGSIKKIAVTTNEVTDIPLTNVSVSGGVITLADADNFATGDIVMVTLIGPDKAYDLALDSQQSIVQNPDYGHYTNVETLVSESAWPGLTAYTDDGAGDANTITDATAAFTLATINDVIGYKVWSITDGTYGNVLSYTSATSIETTGGTIVSWASDAFKIPVAKRYEIPMEGYNFLTLHWRLAADLHTCYIMKIFGTLDATATVDADTNWVDLSTSVFGASSVTADGITAVATVTVEGIKVLDTPTTMLKYMIKIIAEGNAAAATGSSATVFIKKSS